MSRLSGKLLGLIFLLSIGFSAIADEPMSEEEIEAWFESDFEEKAAAVSEGELKFLVEIPDKAVHHIHNTLIITNRSLATGWVGLIQCHQNLDAVPATQVVYRYKEMRGLRIESHSRIAKAWIEGSSVQLENISKNARICVKAEVRIFKPLSDQAYILKNGPFHRKFLDGYYPMKVILKILYPEELIRVHSVKPKIQPGFSVIQQPGEVHVTAWFEGKLITETTFKTID